MLIDGSEIGRPIMSQFFKTNSIFVHILNIISRPYTLQPSSENVPLVSFIRATGKALGSFSLLYNYLKQLKVFTNFITNNLYIESPLNRKISKSYSLGDL